MLTGSELGTDQEGRVHARLTVPFREGRDYALSIEPLRGRQPRPGGQVLAARSWPCAAAAGSCTSPS